MIYSFEGGLSYYFADFEREKSIPLFEAALENTKDDTIPELYYYLAKSYYLNGDYDKSADAFTKFKPFIKMNTAEGKALLEKSNEYLKIDDTGKKYLAKKDPNIKVFNLSEKINSSYGDYAPFLKESDNILLFTSRRKVNSNKTDKDLLPYEDVYVAKQINDVWELITDKKEIQKYIPRNLNTSKHDAGILYSSDGKTLYTYQKDGIWKSLLENEKWSKLMELDENINSSKFNTPSISLSEDGNTMLFVAYRKEGIGEKDIYKSVKNSEGNWGKAENLGDIINSKLDEDSPYLTKDGKTLYFSSKGHNGIGGYDIFKSTLTNGTWSTPENLGIPLNSPSDDIYLVIDKEGINGFLSSDRNGGIGGMDIYSFCTACPTEVIHSINGLIVDNNDAPINSGAINLENKTSKEIVVTSPVQEGKFKLTTSSTGEHLIAIDVPSYEKQGISIALPNESSTSDLTVKVAKITKADQDYQVISVSSNNLGLNLSDTIKVEPLIVQNDTNNSSDGSRIATGIIAEYQENFSYNKKEINLENPKLKEMIRKAVNKGGKIYIAIESSASKVPTKTYKTNINLASLRGDETKIALIKMLKKNGIKEDDIKVNSINSFVSGPDYSGDYKNIEKYLKYQYVKIVIK